MECFVTPLNIVVMFTEALKRYEILTLKNFFHIKYQISLVLDNFQFCNGKFQDTHVITNAKVLLLTHW